MLQTELRRGAAEGRECTVCPPWAVCAHFEGLVIRLCDDELAREILAVEHSHILGRFQVLTGVPVECWCGEHTVLDESEERFLSPSLPAAQAEFRAREAKLLGRAE